MSVNVVVPKEARRRLASLAGVHGFYSPRNPDTPSISAFMRSIAAGECVAIGPLSASDFRIIIAALTYAADHAADLPLDATGRTSAPNLLRTLAARMKAEAKTDETQFPIPPGSDNNAVT